MDLQVVTQATDLAVTTDMLRQNARITNSLESSIIELDILAAQDHAGNDSNRAIITTRYKLTFDKVYPAFVLPRPPFQAFSSLKYTVLGGTEVTVDTSAMTPRYRSMLPQFEIAALADAEIQDGTMEVVWDAGWTPETVPASIKLAVLELATSYFKHREATQMDPRLMDVVKEVPYSYADKIARWRVPNVNDDMQGRW